MSWYLADTGREERGLQIVGWQLLKDKNELEK